MQPTGPLPAEHAERTHFRGAAMDLLVHDVMSTDVATVTPETSLREAHDLIQARDIHHLCVVDENGRLLGVVSDRDLRRALSTPLTRDGVKETERLLDEVHVRRIMHSDPVRVNPTMILKEAARLMVSHRIGSLPVVRNTHLVGILTGTDCLRLIAYGPTSGVP